MNSLDPTMKNNGIENAYRGGWLWGGLSILFLLLWCFWYKQRRQNLKSTKKEAKVDFLKLNFELISALSSTYIYIHRTMHQSSNHFTVNTRHLVKTDKEWLLVVETLLPEGPEVVVVVEERSFFRDLPDQSKRVKKPPLDRFLSTASVSIISTHHTNWIRLLTRECIIFRHKDKKKDQTLDSNRIKKQEYRQNKWFIRPKQNKKKKRFRIWAENGTEFEIL